MDQLQPLQSAQSPAIHSASSSSSPEEEVKSKPKPDVKSQTASGEPVGATSLFSRTAQHATTSTPEGAESSAVPELEFCYFKSIKEAVFKLSHILPLGRTPLGRGTYGEVYSGKDKSNKVWAVKVSNANNYDGLQVDPDRGEVALLGVPDHPRINRVHSVLVGRIEDIKIMGQAVVRGVLQNVVRSDGLFALISSPEQLKGQDLEQLYVAGAILEFVVGQTLTRHLSAFRGTKEEFARLFYQLAEGLAHLHSLGFAHRDLSDGNIMLSRDGDVTLIDFGSLKKALARTGSWVGTYQLMDKDILTMRSGGYDAMALDQMELGGVMLFYLTGGYLGYFNSASDCFNNEALQLFGRVENTRAFLACSQQEKFWAINHNLRPGLKDIDQEYLALVLDLLDPVPGQRPTAEQVMGRLKAIELKAAKDRS